MSNPANSTTVLGRLAADPVVFENSDGSKKVLFNVMVDRNYQNAKGEYVADAIPVEAFIRKGVQGTGPYANIHKGDLVAIGASLRQDRFMKNGVEQFQLKVVADTITYLEPKSVTQARLASRVAAAEARQQTQAAPATAQAAPAVAQAAPAIAADLPFGG